MKKKVLFPLITLLLTFTLACSLFNPTLFGSDDATSPEDAPAEIPAESVPNETSPSSSDSGACNNIFYPLVVGQQTIYKSTSPEGETKTGLTVSKVEGNFATVDMLNISTGIVSQSIAECEDGALKNFPAATMGSAFGDMLNGAMTMDYVSGYIAPSEATFIANNWDMSWESEYVMNGEITMDEEGESMTATIDNSPVLMKWKTISTGETVIVEAGTYTNVVKVSREMTMNITIDMDGTKLDSELVIQSTHWFEPYIGMVKMEITEVSISMEGITFPVPMNETMELIEFRAAK